MGALRRQSAAALRTARQRPGERRLLAHARRRQCAKLGAGRGADRSKKKAEVSKVTVMWTQKSAVKKESEEVQGGPPEGPTVQDTEGTMCLSIAQKYADASSELQEALSEMEESYNAAVRITGKAPPNMPNMNFQQTFYTASGAHFCQIGATPKAQAKSRAAASGGPGQADNTENQEPGVTLEEITELIHEGKMEEANVIAEQVSKLIQEDMEKVHAERVSKLIQEGMEKVHKNLYDQLKEGSEKHTYQVQREIASVKQEFNNATAEQVNKLIQEGLKEVHYDLFAKLKVGSDKLTDEVHREIASVKQELNNLHVNVQNNCDQVKELGEKLQRTQEEAAAASAKSEERIDKKFDDKFDELKGWLMQNIGSQISSGASSASAAGHHTPGSGARSAKQDVLQEEQPKAKAAKKEGIGVESL